MRPLLAVAAALLAAGPAAAQQMYTPVPPPPVPPATAYPRPAPPLWTYDNGPSSPRPTRAPSDSVAEELNRQELMRGAATGYPPPPASPPR